MRHTIVIAAAALVALVASAACGGGGDAPAPASATPPPIENAVGVVERIEVTPAGGAAIGLWVEVPVDDQDYRTGLMGRAPLPDEQGMLFVMATRRSCGFWMKDTPSPLSIAFIDEGGVIVDIQEMAPFDETLHSPPGGRCGYALEVAQGWFARNGVAIGDKVTFPWPADSPPPYPLPPQAALVADAPRNG